MATLKYEDLPMREFREPVYVRYVPIVEEFAKSGKPSARVEDDEANSATVMGRIKNAIDHSEHKGEVKACTRKGSVWLYRVGEAE